MLVSVVIARSIALARFARLGSLVALTLSAVAEPRLQPVVVTASRFAGPAVAVPAGASVVIGEQTQRAGVGIVSESDLTSAGLASMAIDSVERVEILRGTGAVLYGDEASGGGIPITTKAGVGVQRANGAALHAAAGSLGLHELRTSAALAGVGFTLDAAVANRGSSGHRVSFASGSDSTSATLQSRNEWLRVGARLARDTMPSGRPGALSAAQFATNPTQADSLAEYGANLSSRGGLVAEANLGNWLAG